MTLAAARLSMPNGYVSSGQKHNLLNSSYQHYVHSLKNLPHTNCSCGNDCLCSTVSAGDMAARLGHITHNAIKYIFQVWDLPLGD